MKRYLLLIGSLLAISNIFAGTVTIHNNTDGQVKIVITFTTAPNGWIPNISDRSFYVESEQIIPFDTRGLCPQTIDASAITGKAATKTATYQAVATQCYDISLDLKTSDNGELILKEHATINSSQ